jgi:hypothetical protein
LYLIFFAKCGRIRSVVFRKEDEMGERQKEREKTEG